MKPSSVFDVLSELPGAQKRYRDSEPFREYIDALDTCLREAEEQLTTDEYVMFVQELIGITKSEVARRHAE